MTAAASTFFPHVTIDGERLKQARLAMDWHIDDASARITISRTQLQQIESGEERAFYSRSHKLLAVKKYADALGLPFDSVVTVHEPVPADSATAGMQAGAIARRDAPVPPVVAARRRAASGWRQTLTVMAPLIFVLALMAQFAPARYGAVPSITETILPVALAPAIAAPARVVADASAVIVAVPAVVRDSAPAQLAETPPVVRALVTAAPDAARPGTNGRACGNETAGQSMPDWAPAQVRKPDTNLYLRSAAPSTVCITDANGTSEAIALKPQVLHTFAGKPPYTLRAEQFGQLDVYFQGLRVKVPFEVQAVRLVAGNI